MSRWERSARGGAAMRQAVGELRRDSGRVARRIGAALAAGVLATAGAAAAPDDGSKSATAALALCKQLEQAKLQYVAARDPKDPARYVAAMHFPGQQLMVVSAKYGAPALLNE